MKSCLPIYVLLLSLLPACNAFPVGSEILAQIHLFHNRTFSPSHHSSSFQSSIILSCYLLPRMLRNWRSLFLTNKMSTSKLFKPLLDQPTAAPSDLNQPTKPQNPAKPAKRHENKVTCKWLKTRAATALDTRSSRYPCPHHQFTFQDTCRILVILALSEGLFKHFQK